MKSFHANVIFMGCTWIEYQFLSVSIDAEVVALCCVCKELLQFEKGNSYFAQLLKQNVS